MAPTESDAVTVTVARRVDDLIECQREHRTTGLETWFELPGRTAPAPPRWKMALVTLVAVIPISMLLNALLQPRIATWPLPARSAAFGAIFVVLMTWVAMPRLTRWFSRFLYPG